MNESLINFIFSVYLDLSISCAISLWYHKLDSVFDFISLGISILLIVSLT